MEEYEEAFNAAEAALRRCEAVGATRYEVVEWMNQSDAISTLPKYLAEVRAMVDERERQEQGDGEA